MKAPDASDSIGIFLRDCAVKLFVGIHDREKPQAQTVIVHVEMTAALTARYDDIKSGDMASVIDYERLYTFVVQDLPKLGHVPLLESVAERIADFCFQDARVVKVRVRLDKPEAFAGKAIAGIELTRSRL